MNVFELIKFLKDKNTRKSSWGMNVIDTSFETMPSEFIGFAESDLQSPFEHKYINALSNAKRALDCQADRLLKLFGYYQESQDKFWGFPKKIELIQKFEIIAPRVLNKINRTRNLMEHQYIKPKTDEVEDFLDIASLFIASTDHYVSNFITYIHYANEDSEEFEKYLDVNIIYDNDKAVLKIKTQLLKQNEIDIIEFEVKKGDAEYINLLKTHLKKIEFR